MLVSIDGKPIPHNGRSNLTAALFIRQHLRPESVISYIDFEGCHAYVPTYESLSAYAEMCLGAFGLRLGLGTTPFRTSRNADYDRAIRSAVAKLCGHALRTLATEPVKSKVKPVVEKRKTTLRYSPLTVDGALLVIDSFPFSAIDAAATDRFAYHATCGV